MSIRANWFAPVTPVASDPFAMPIEQAGTPIDLSGEEATLQHELLALMNAEAELFDLGVSCSIRDRADTCCHACPVSKHTSDETFGQLCRNGRQVEVVVTKLAVIANGG